MGMRIIAFEERDALHTPTDTLIRQSGGGWVVFSGYRRPRQKTRVAISDGDGCFSGATEGVAAGQHVALFPGEMLFSDDPVQMSSR